MAKKKKTTTVGERLGERVKSRRTSYRSQVTGRVEGVAFSEEEMEHVRAWLDARSKRGWTVTRLLTECETALVDAGVQLPNKAYVRDAALAKTREPAMLRHMKVVAKLAAARERAS